MMDEALKAVVSELGFEFQLKKEQKEILEQLNEKKHVFAQLPTGFGKSVCFVLHPLVQDTLHPDAPFKHLALVISPLNALMMDQVERWRQHGVRCAAIMGRDSMSEEDVKDVMDGNVSVLYTSPEAILDRRRPWWHAVLERQRDRICVIAVDEVHCMLSWGDTFRAQYMELPRLRAVLREVPVLLLTATITKEDMDTVVSAFGITVNVTAVLPDRPTIYLRIDAGSADFEVRLEWLLEHMRSEGARSTKTIIYTRDIDTAAEIAGWLTDDLGPAAFLTGTKPAASSRIVDLYHGETHASDQQRILKNFVQDTHLRVLVATVAFGMGIEIRDVRSVIMWGPPKDLLTFWQEVGRAGRDGAPAEAIVYLYPHAVNTRFIAEDMCELCQSYGDECIRKHVLRRFSLCKETDNELGAIGGGARCCSTCDEK